MSNFGFWLIIRSGNGKSDPDVSVYIIRPQWLSTRDLTLRNLTPFQSHHELSWTVINPYELSWIFMICHESAWAVMNHRELSWIVTNRHEPQCILMNPSEASGPTMNSCESSWTVINCHEPSNSVLNCHELTWIFMHRPAPSSAVVKHHQEYNIFRKSIYTPTLHYSQACIVRQQQSNVNIQQLI